MSQSKCLCFPKMADSIFRGTLNGVATFLFFPKFDSYDTRLLFYTTRIESLSFLCYLYLICLFEKKFRRFLYFFVDWRIKYSNQNKFDFVSSLSATKMRTKVGLLDHKKHMCKLNRKFNSIFRAPCRKA